MKLSIINKTDQSAKTKNITFGFLPKKPIFEILENTYANNFKVLYADVRNVYILGSLRKDHKTLVRKEFCLKYPQLSSNYSSNFDDMQILYGQKWENDLEIRVTGTNLGFNKKVFIHYYIDAHDNESQYHFKTMDIYHTYIKTLDLYPICMDFECRFCKVNMHKY